MGQTKADGFMYNIVCNRVALHTNFLPILISVVREAKFPPISTLIRIKITVEA
jgi:hypothetical protein